ncbi:MAG: ABC transporter substrate-binding protein, partial [Desulfobulbaceae bacterium]|nr:ABC transporter substrate-binding protein [Desulfobulbaceae bacterium]
MNCTPARLVILLCLFFLLPLLDGCRQRGEDPGQELTFRLKWLYNINTAGDLYALEHGFFTSRGLRVAVKPGGPERDAIRELELGRAQFGVASADQVIRALAKGAPIVVIAQLFQQNPLQWIYRSGGAAYANPLELRGKTVGITYGGNDETIMRALLAKYNIAPSKVNLFSVRYDYAPFYLGEVDLWPVYRNAEGIVIAEKMARAGEQIGFFVPDLFDVRFVANSVITTRKMVEEHPDLVRKFRDALLNAWQEALASANADRTIALVHAHDQGTPEEIIAKQLVSTRQLMLPENGQFGRIDVAAWRQTGKIMLEQGVIDLPVAIEKALLTDGLKP